MIGEHIIGTIETEEKSILTSQSRLKEIVLESCNICGLRVVGEKFYEFDSPKGITYCFILSQSHLILHSWPEDSRLFFDIFTCGNEKNAEEFIKKLATMVKGRILSLSKIKI